MRRSVINAMVGVFVVVALGLAGCGGGDSGPNSTPTSLGANNNPAPNTAPDSGAPPIVDASWNITVTGTASEPQGGVSRSFQKAGKLYIISAIATPNTPNGVNPYEMAVAVGDPTTYRTWQLYPTAGEFEFATYMQYYQPVLGNPPVPTKDLALVGYDTNHCLLVRPATPTADSGALVNTFVVINVAAKITDGYIQICSNDGFNTVSGKINMVGLKGIGNQEQYYLANLTGTLASQ